jgi:allantoin racemase
MRRILVAIPVSSDEWDPVILRLCQAVANHSTQLAVAHLERGVTELESSLDEALVTEPLLQLLSERADTFDGVIVDCYIDPGIAAVRELIQKPAVGIGEAAEFLAYLVGHRIGLVTTNNRGRRSIEEKARARGTMDRIVAVRSWSNSPLELLHDDERALKTLKSLVAEMRDKDAIDTVIITCGPNLALERDLSAELGLPVIVPVQAAVKLVEALLDCRLPVSSAYPHPHRPEQSEVGRWTARPHVEGVPERIADEGTATLVSAPQRRPE